MLRRMKDYRPTWKFNQTEPVAGNYYPCNSAAVIRDHRHQLTLLVDSAQGVASLSSGQLEAMVHRRMVEDDHRGVNEPLNETQFVTSYTHGDPDLDGQHFGPGLVVRGKHVLSVERASRAAAHWRPLADRVFSPPVTSFSRSKSTAGQAGMPQSALADPLPANVQLMTMQATDEGRLLVRLTHQFGIDEDLVMSAPVILDLATMFSNKSAGGFDVLAAQEMSLSANTPKSELLARRRSGGASWSANPSELHAWRRAPAVEYDASMAGSVSSFTIGPLEIKTFLLTVG